MSSFSYRTVALAALATTVAVDVAAAQGQSTRNASAVVAGKQSGKPFNSKFVDIAPEAGLDLRFVYGDEKSKQYIMEVNGSGVALVDYDGDNLLDAFLVNGSTFGENSTEAESRLYRNQGDGRFEDVTAEAGVGRSGWGTGVCAGDYDNDGATDLYVAYWGANALYRNSGEGGFKEVAESAGVAGRAEEWTSGCTFVDVDRDGLLDLLTTQYQRFDPKTTPKAGATSTCQWKGMPVFCGPRGLPYGGATLYRNKGDGLFEDISESSGIRAPQGYYAFTAVATDFNGDGWLDIYVACDSTPNLFFVNNGDGTFTDFATETGLAFNEHGNEQGGMGLGVGDLDNDGLLDIIKTNFAGDYPNVYHNLGDGIYEDLVIRAGLGANPQFVGWGVQLVDLDNDGLQDVFQVNGHVYPELDAQTNINETFRQPGVVYRNLGGGRFEDVSALAGPAVQQQRSSRGAAFGDFDNDGDVDVLVMNMSEQVSLFRNDLDSTNHWLRVKLRGTVSNRDAIGAVIRVTAGGSTQARAVLSQDSYLSHSDLRAHFGLGSATSADSITVQWPSGKTEDFPGAAADQEVLLVEGEGEVRQTP